MWAGPSGLLDSHAVKPNTWIFVTKDHNNWTATSATVTEQTAWIVPRTTQELL